MQKSRAVIRGLWGDYLLQRPKDTYPHSFYRLLCDVRRAARNHERVDRVYCYGLENERYLRACGFRTVRLSDDAFGFPPSDLLRPDKRAPKHHGTCIWDQNHHAFHKLRIMERALLDFDEVVWVDWDVRQVRLLHDSWWDKQTSPFKGIVVRQGNWTWGAKWRRRAVRYSRLKKLQTTGNPEDAQMVVHAGCFYCSSIEFIKMAMEAQLFNRTWMMQQCLAAALDRMNGGAWMGLDEFFRRGHWATWYRHSLQVHENRPDQLIWDGVLDGRANKIYYT